MMEEQQFDTANEQPAGQPKDALTTRDIVSAGRRGSGPTDAPDADATDDRATSRDHPTEEYAADAGTTAQRGRLDRERAPRDDGLRDDGVRDDRSATHDGAERERRADEPSPAPLLSAEATGAYQARWDAIQTAFVDEPRRVVEQADGLVAEVMQRLAETFARERASLERHWDQGGDNSTEDLRLSLQRYRSFFQRLLST